MTDDRKKVLIAYFMGQLGRRSEVCSSHRGTSAGVAARSPQARFPTPALSLFSVRTSTWPLTPPLPLLSMFHFTSALPLSVRQQRAQQNGPQLQNACITVRLDVPKNHL
jgi:hypothetical protein